LNNNNNTNNTQENIKTLQGNNKIEFLNIAKAGAETKNTLITKINSKSAETLKKIENFSLLKYQYDPNILSFILTALCPFVRLCNSKLNKDIAIMEYSKKHYYKYTDFFKFVDRTIESSMLKKLLLKKEESDAIDTLKRIVLVKKFDILDIVNPKLNDSDEYYKNSVNKVNDKIKSKGSLSVHEERLKKYISSIANKENKTVFEQNLVDRFDELII